MKKKREPYRTNHGAALVELDQKRRTLGVSIEDLCTAADISVATWWRMQRSGLAFRRRIKALTFALRTLEQQRRKADGFFPGAPS